MKVDALIAASFCSTATIILIMCLAFIAEHSLILAYALFFLFTVIYYVILTDDGVTTNGVSNVQKAQSKNEEKLSTRKKVKAKIHA